MVQAHSCAVSVNKEAKFDNLEHMQEIVAARMPCYAHEFYSLYNKTKSDEGRLLGFKDLLAFLTQKIDVLKMVEQTQKTQTVKIHATEVKETKPQYGPRTFAQQTADSPKKTQTSKCLHCNGGHETADCMKLFTLSLEDRVSIITKLKICFHCLTGGHNAKDCPEKRNVTCTTCGKKGHIALFHGRPMMQPSNGLSTQRNDNIGLKIVDPPRHPSRKEECSAGDSTSAAGPPKDDEPTI